VRGKMEQWKRAKGKKKVAAKEKICHSKEERDSKGKEPQQEVRKRQQRQKSRKE
jgi:hypothetical protein